MQGFVASSGYLAVFLLILADSACVPIPSEVTMLAAGALAAQGTLALGWVIVVSILGALAGSYIAWAVGRTGGRAIMERLARVALIRPDDLERAETWFARRGEVAVFVGRLIPVVRSFISLPAGIAEMEPLRFGVYTTLGCAIWNAALAGAGYALGANWHSIVHGFTAATVVVVVLAVAGAVVLLIRARRRRREAARLAPPSRV